MCVCVCVCVCVLPTNEKKMVLKRQNSEYPADNVGLYLPVLLYSPLHTHVSTYIIGDTHYLDSHNR